MVMAWSWSIWAVIWGLRYCSELVDGAQPIPWRHDQFGEVGFTHPSSRIDGIDRVIARAVEIQVRGERLVVETVDGCGVFLVNMAIADHFAHHGAVLALGQRVIVGLARARADELNAQLLEQAGDIVIKR